jgi:hypothetical protein
VLTRHAWTLQENTGEEPSLYKVIEQKVAGADQQGMMGTSHMCVALCR